MKRALIILLLFTSVQASSFAQDSEPKDYLSKEFHAGRREALRQIMPDNSVVVVFAYPVQTFSNDVDYLYHQNPDLYYFTGYKEPDAVLFIFKEAQTDANGNSFKELFFVQKRNPLQESWTGKRLGTEGVKEKLGIPMTFNGEDFKAYPLDLSKFKNIIYSASNNTMAAAQENASLGGLVASFVAKKGKNGDPGDSRLFMKLTGQLRGIKTPEEIHLLRKAIEISCIAQNEVIFKK